MAKEGRLGVIRKPRILSARIITLRYRGAKVHFHLGVVKVFPEGTLRAGKKGTCFKFVDEPGLFG